MATIPALAHTQNAFIWRFIIVNPSDSRVVPSWRQPSRKRVTVARPVVLPYSLPVFVRG